MRQIVLIAHNIRSTHNVGSLLRTAEGLGIKKVYLTGYTPYPLTAKDSRLPHLALKINNRIAKTALGAEKSMHWENREQLQPLLTELRLAGFEIAALEQAVNSVTLGGYRPAQKTALIVGREVEGIEPEILKQADIILEIPMHGQKESFNVAVATAIALYSLKTNQ